MGIGRPLIRLTLLGEHWTIQVIFWVLNVFCPRYLNTSRLVNTGQRVKDSVDMDSNQMSAILILTISKVKQEDGGNYTCAPDSGGQASQVLHVIAGKRRLFFSQNCSVSECLTPSIISSYFETY